jgi:hypothetical protein
MKQLALLTLLLFTTILSFGQSIDIIYNNITLNNGDTIVFTSTNNTATFAFPLSITNTSNQLVNVRVRKIELSIVPGSDNYFCNWTSCYTPSVFESPDSLPMMPADTFKQFSCDYASNGHPGTSYVMYTFYNDSDHNDSMSVVGKYMAGSPAAIDLSNNSYTVSNAYPNPAKNVLFIDYNFTNAKFASIEIHNILGSIVQHKSIGSLSGKAKIDVSNLKNGIYFYTIIIDNQKYISKKFIVQR